MSHSRELKWRIEWPDFRIKCAGLHVKLQLIYSYNEMMPIHLDNKFQHTHFDTICNRFASTSNYSFPSHSCNFLLYLYLLSPHSHISLSIHSHFRVFPFNDRSMTIVSSSTPICHTVFTMLQFVSISTCHEHATFPILNDQKWIAGKLFRVGIV